MRRACAKRAGYAFAPCAEESASLKKFTLFFPNSLLRPKDGLVTGWQCQGWLRQAGSWLLAGVMTTSDLCVNLLSASLPSGAQTFQ
jgi:hypothetical protein